MKGAIVKKKYLTSALFSIMIAKVISMERIVEQAFLYDFYGELLTVHQRQIYEDFVLNNLSFSEIAEERGISRQGVHDLVRRCDKILAGYEDKLHLLEKFLNTRKKISEIHELVTKQDQLETNQIFYKIEEISREILKNL